MLGIEEALCNAGIEAISVAYYAVMNSTVDEALRPICAYGKSDTLGLDAVPEITIVEKLQEFDQHAVIITEETGANQKHRLTHSRDPQRFRTVFICDPTDRSDQMRSFLTKVQDRKRTVGEVLRSSRARLAWEKEHGKPVEITGCSSAITGVRRGKPIFSVLANYLTGKLFVVCSAGNYVADLPRQAVPMTFSEMRSTAEQLHFRGPNPNGAGDSKKFVTFLGKSGYRENLIGSKLVSEREIKKLLHYGLPGGPLRILYLSTLQPADSPIGFVLANGEKIGEWIHWLTFIRFSRMKSDQGESVLRLYEVYQDRPQTKEGILMSTPPSYSIFRGTEEDPDTMMIDVGRFPDFANPSQIRSTLIAAPRDNDWATRAVNQYGYRPIRFDAD